MKFSITCLLIFFFQFCIAQDTWINYTNFHKINDLVETDQNFWFGSEGGLCQYNKLNGQKTFYNRGNSLIPSNEVFDLLYQSNGDLWMTTSLGIGKIKNGEFVLGPAHLTGIMRESLDNKVIVANTDSLYIQEEGMEFKAIPYPSYVVEIGGIEVDQITGSIYINAINYFAETYVAEWKNDQWTFLFSDYVYETSMTIDQQNKLWMISFEGLQYHEDGNWTSVPNFEQGNGFLSPKLFVDNDNNILIHIHRECPEIIIWDGNSAKSLKYSEDACPEYDCFIKPSEQESNRYYASNLYNGFYSFDSEGIDSPERLAQSPVLYNTITNTLHLSDGSHIVVYFDRIQSITSEIWTEIPLPVEMEKIVNQGFLDHNDNLWIYNDDFLWSYPDGEWLKLSPPAEITERIALMEIGVNGDIWIQSGLHIARYRNNEWKVFNSIDHDITTTIIKDMKVDPKNGDLWVTTFQGVRQYNGESWKRYDIQPINHTYNLTLGNGYAFVFSGSKIIKIKDEVVDTIDLPEYGLYHQQASELNFDNKTEKLYLTGSNVMAVYENEEWTIYHPENSGLYNGFTEDISIDLNNNIWLSGRNGGLGIFNSEGISLSIQNDPDSKAFLSSIKIYPTLLLENVFYIETEKSGIYTIDIYNLQGEKIYNREHFISRHWPEALEVYGLPAGAFLVTLSYGSSTVSMKLVKL